MSCREKTCQHEGLCGQEGPLENLWSQSHLESRGLSETLRPQTQSDCLVTPGDSETDGVSEQSD